MTSESDKDSMLDRLADSANVAQFVSFAPNGRQRFVRISGTDETVRFQAQSSAIQALLRQSPEGRVNIRTFRTAQTKGGDFLYGLTSAAEVEAHVQRLTTGGWYVIVNETVDVNDGGVSGVALGDLVEFAPGDTPRCVEKSGTCRLRRSVANRVLEVVYGFQPDISPELALRTEFSIHPLRRGHRNDHTIIWEIENSPALSPAPQPSWPNRFSEFLGDKVFGLLIAHALKCSIPFTQAFPRSVAPFSFGDRTNTNEHWLRTAPRIQSPGEFPTTRGWSDPFELLANIPGDNGSTGIAAIICQEGVDAVYSGAAAVAADGSLIIEGVSGSGVNFMLGQSQPHPIPWDVERDVHEVMAALIDHCGPVRIEWAHDGHKAWVLQLHSGGISSNRNVIFPGDANRWINFAAVDGLESLRKLINGINAENAIGIRIVGDIGITSHFGDLLRSHKIPSEIIR